ncbi:hypothetical protein OAM69_01410 [bacterium]|nr:hypothetical protein [bacterium]
MSRDEQSDHLNLLLDDVEGATLQQLQGEHFTPRKSSHGYPGLHDRVLPGTNANG